MTVKVIDIGHLPGWPTGGTGGAGGHLRQGIIAIGGIGHGIPGERAQAVPLVVGKDIGFAGACVGGDIAACVIGIGSEGGGVLVQAYDAVGGGGIGRQPCGGGA